VPFNTWTPHAVSSEAFAWQGQVWRIVEAQHTASTMKLVDTLAEQDLLETLLESSKPKPRSEALGLHYLLATPFRYNPKRGGSRFRSEIDPGVFYGAQSIRTAAAELGYWRWRFVKDSVGLDQLNPLAHTVFSCDLACSAVDLREEPFLKHQSTWLDSDQYVGTQHLARAARKSSIQSILYWSTRDPQPSWCIAILDALVFKGVRPEIDPQTWFLSVNQTSVSLRSQADAYTYEVDELLRNRNNAFE